MIQSSQTLSIDKNKNSFAIFNLNQMKNLEEKKTVMGIALIRKRAPTRNVLDDNL